MTSLLTSIIGGGIVIFFAIIALLMISQSLGEKRFTRRMRRLNRVKDWKGIKENPELGTLIIEQAQKQGCRFWWTDEEVAKTSPFPVPTEENLDYLNLDSPDEFTVWCQDRYLNEHNGIAFLTSPPFKLPPGFVSSDFMQSVIPSLKLVFIVKQKEASPEFSS